MARSRSQLAKLGLSHDLPVTSFRTEVRRTDRTSTTDGASMTETLPIMPEERLDEPTLRERVARARRAREEAADRVERDYAAIKPDKRRWRVRDELDLGSERSIVR